MTDIWRVFLYGCTLIGMMVVAFVALFCALDVYEWAQKRYRPKICFDCRVQLGPRAKKTPCPSDACDKKHYVCPHCNKGPVQDSLIPLSWEKVFFSRQER